MVVTHREAQAARACRLTDHGPAAYAQRVEQMLALQLHAGAAWTGGAAEVAAGICQLHIPRGQR